MNTMRDDAAVPEETDPRVQRAHRTTEIRRLARKATRAEEALVKAIEDRDNALIESHGDKREGRLSYVDLARASGVSKGRVIQIVQGKSDYSKRQRRLNPVP